MNEYNKITALYSRLSVGDEDRDGGESNSIVNQKAFLERYAQQQRLTNIRHYIDDDESGRFLYADCRHRWSSNPKEQRRRNCCRSILSVGRTAGNCKLR